MAAGYLELTGAAGRSGVAGAGATGGPGWTAHDEEPE